MPNFSLWTFAANVTTPPGLRKGCRVEEAEGGYQFQNRQDEETIWQPPQEESSVESLSPRQNQIISMVNATLLPADIGYPLSTQSQRTIPVALPVRVAVISAEIISVAIPWDPDDIAPDEAVCAEEIVDDDINH